MTIRHHLNETILLAHAAGELPEAFNLVVATHLTLCDDCRARALALDALGGAVIARGEAISLPDAVVEAALARITGLAPVGEARPVSVARQGVGRVPAPLSDYVGADLGAVRWRSVGLGVRQAILDTGRAATARLLFIPGGQAMPDHGHGGLELTLVLQGAFDDGAERFGPGDIEIADQTTTHRPVAAPGADCICLAASDARLRFSGLLPRLAQPFLRI